MDVRKLSAALFPAALLLVISGGTAGAGARPSTQKTTASDAQPAPAPANPKEQQLISAAENAYASGMRNYHAGNLPAAKRDFDTAVDTMLAGGVDLKSSPALSDEFEHIVDAINALEMDALKQGNGFTPAMEQTPVGVANDVTFPVDPNIRAAAEAELKTTQSDLPLVIKVRNGAPPFTYFANGAPFSQAAFARQGSWRPDGPGFVTLSVVDAEGRSDSVKVFLQ